MIRKSGTRFSEKDHAQQGQAMTDNNGDGPTKGTIGLFLGGICALAAAFFLLTGGELGGKKTVRGDADLPPVASPVPPAQ
jgi:hypothetical protein